MRKVRHCLKAFARKTRRFSLAALLTASAGWAAIAPAADWTDPPAIDMQDCIRVEKSLGRNPFSTAPNDIAQVTSYEEKRDEAVHPPDKALYLVNGILVDRDRQTEIVYFTALIVTIGRDDREVRRASYWVLADTDGDGRLDKGVLREKEISGTGDEALVTEAQATDEQLAVLQTYYEEASDNLSSKADSEVLTVVTSNLRKVTRSDMRKGVGVFCRDSSTTRRVGSRERR